MAKQKTELEKRNVVRLSNKEAKQLTKSCLQTALTELLETKNLSDISVSELTRRAGVSRTAFYSNYQTVNDVLAEFIDEHLTEINNSVWEALNDDRDDMFYDIVKKMHDEFDVYSLVLKSDIEKATFLQMRDYIKKTYPSVSVETYYLIIAVVGMLRNIILEWFITGCRESDEMISELCAHVTKDLKGEIFSRLSA